MIPTVIAPPSLSLHEHDEQTLSHKKVAGLEKELSKQSPPTGTRLKG